MSEITREQIEKIKTIAKAMPLHSVLIPAEDALPLCDLALKCLDARDKWREEQR